MRILIVGGGMAGTRVASEVHARRPDWSVTLLGTEPHPAYNRIQLANLIGGKVDEEALALAEPAGRGVQSRAGVTVTAIDRTACQVSTSDGEVLDYDRLVLATGSRPLLPPIKGLVHDDGSMPERAIPFRTLDDCRRIVELARRSRTALVLGGGLLGLEAARGLAARGLTVTVLHAAGHLMERQLDPPASAVLAASLEPLGVGVELDAATTRLICDDDSVEAVLGDGRRLRAELFVVACGVRPETALADTAGLAVERGVVVDDRLRTSDPRIFALGDCAQHDGVVTGLVAPAWEQARVVADVITGTRPLARYLPRPAVVRLKAAGIDLAALGDSTHLGGDQLTFADPAGGTYAKLVVRDQRLAGAIMLGDNPSVGTVIQLFDRGGPLPGDVRSLLLGRVAPGAAPAVAAGATPALMPDAAVVCQCNSVSKGALLSAWRGGATSVDHVVAETRATTGCGGCRDAVAGIVSWLSTSEGVNAR
jgi:assimilatory nitrate reductase electron transfer subunit